ncbi:hypothetical protein CEXT_279601 [Caerostris extrusa]|uniref:Uncharacterized protein n=1 Tax=Caerostris extrusa TaxID=172846 RepID=A0AAV4X3H5_CAEEX|nr:hypothetical protein CEXT_279601 [Caerostris extrusa]
MCEENWVDVTNERFENTFLIPVCLSRPSQQTIEYRLLRPTPSTSDGGKRSICPGPQSLRFISSLDVTWMYQTSLV